MKKHAETNLSNYPNLVVTKIRQLLGDFLDKTDEINLQAAETFPNDKILFALMVRSLSPDIPNAKLTKEEQLILDNALLEKGAVHKKSIEEIEKPIQSDKISIIEEAGLSLYDYEKLEQIYLNKRALNVMWEIIQNLLKQYPPDEFHYVFIGRSLEFLEILLKESSLAPTNVIPFFAASRQNNAYKFASENEKKFMKQRLQEHFKTFLPSKSQLGKKQILFLDFSRSFCAITAFNEIANDVITDDIKFKTLALSYKTPRIEISYLDTESSHDKLKRYNIDYMLFSYELGRYLEEDYFKYYSRYPKCEPVLESFRNPECKFPEKYLQFVKTLKKLIEEKGYS